MGAMDGMPNKPMVATATTLPSDDPPYSLRRHIGRPFGSFGDGRTGHRAKLEASAGTHRHCERRAVSYGKARFAPWPMERRCGLWTTSEERLARFAMPAVDMSG